MAAVEALAKEGNVIFISEFQVQPGRGEEFISLFREFDYSDANLMHKEPAQVKDGVLCRDPKNPERFFLIGEWQTQDSHQKALVKLRESGIPPFFSLVQGGLSSPLYLDVVMSTPPEYLS